MKKLITLLFFSFIFGITGSAHAQAGKDGFIIIHADQASFTRETQSKTDSITHNGNRKITTLTGNVSLKEDRLEIGNAGKVVYDGNAKKISIYDCKNFTFYGKLVYKSTASQAKTIEYTLGDDTIYIL